MNQQAQQNQQRGLQTTRDHSLTGSVRSATEASRRLAFAEEHYHLVAPATSVGQVPEGCAVALSMVHVDTRDMREGGEVYSPGGGLLALSRTALNRIANAAGVSWDPLLSGRLDDGSDPHYVHFRAVGTMRTFDGTEITLCNEKEMDLRDGSPQLVGKSDKQVRELRLHILAHAESKAKNRAIRAIGLKPAYSRKDLNKPFVVAKLMWTGQSDDPALRQRFAEMTAARMLGGAAALYGGRPEVATRPGPTSPALPQGAAGHAPPPVGTVVDDEPFNPPMPYDIDAVGESVGESVGEPVAPPPRPSPRPAPPAAAGGYSGVVVPGKKGRDAGKPIEEAEDRTLEWWCKTIEENLESGKTDPRWRDRDEQKLAAMRAELERRNGGDHEEPPDGYYDDEEGPY